MPATNDLKHTGIKLWIGYAILLASVCNVRTSGQDKMLEINESVSGMDAHLRPQPLSGLSWQGTSRFYTWVDNERLIRRNVRSGKQEVLTTLQVINTALEENGHDTLECFPDYEWFDNQNLSFVHGGCFFVYCPAEDGFTTKICLPEKADNIDPSPSGRMVAYTLGNNLFIAGENRQIQVTFDQNPDIVNGDDYVHRQEFNISRGTFWSPGSGYLAFYRKDESMVDRYPLVDISQRIARTKMIPYPMAGQTSEQVRLGIYCIEKDALVFAESGDGRDQYLTCITWAPDEKHIYIAVLNRDQDHLKLQKFMARDGRLIKTLFDETHPKYIEPEDPLIFSSLLPDRFLWISERDGYRHLYLYHTSGELIRQLTVGKWIVKEVVGFSADGQKCYFLSTKDDPLGTCLCSTDMDNGGCQKITSLGGRRRIHYNQFQGLSIDELTSVDTPLDYYLLSKNGHILEKLHSAKNPLAEYRLGETRIITVKSADGKYDLYGRLILPPDFDHGKKYPVIVYVYGGPHSQLVQNRWLAGARMWQHYMAQRGYLSFTLDNRGTSSRGIEFENAIYRHVGFCEVNDQMKGIEFLLRQDYVDSNRIGVHGWSYGGFMTLLMLNRHPEMFKVGVAGGPVTDWRLYEVMYGERYMDTPQDNPGGYRESSLINKAGTYKGKQLLIHGAQDPVVVWQNSLLYIRECIKKQIQVDYFVYPSHEHNVRGKDRIHLMKKVSEYFFEYL